MGFRRFFVLCALLPYSLASQENSVLANDETCDTVPYSIDYSSGTPRFIQRLSWYPEKYASLYEICIEETPSSGSYREVLRTTTTESHIDVSLPPGLYRYRIQAYDLFEKPAGDPPWIPLEILPALRPELSGVNPDTFTKKDNSFSAAFWGRNIPEGARVVLKNRKTGAERSGVLYAGPDGGSGRVVFSPLPQKGTYDLVIINPGGLRDSFGPVSVFPEKGNHYFSAGYKPMVSLYGELNEMLDAKFHPLGFGGRFWTLPFNAGNFRLGFEAAADYHFLFSDYSSGGLDYRVTGHFAGLALHAVVRKQFSERLSARFHAGGGIAAAINFKKENPLFNIKAVNVLFPAAGAGISGSFRFSDSWFAMLGLEYLHLFSADKTDPAYFSPYIGIGITL
jgi:hypothetical protein